MIVNVRCVILLFFLTTNKVLLIDNDAIKSQVSLQIKNAEMNETEFKHECGGAILRSNWIITSAQCLHKVKGENVRISAGLRNLSMDEGQKRYVSKIFIHPNYSSQQEQQYDVALALLDSPLDFNGNVGNVSLPLENSPLGGQGLFTGFGDELLQTGQLNIISNSVCIWMITHNLHNCHLKVDEETNFCTRDYIKAACNGPKGNPLFISEQLVGIVSDTAIPCGSGPTVFVKISNRAIRDFIVAVILDN